MNCIKFSGTLFLILAAPLIAEAGYILNLWLKNPPEYSVSFCSICLAATFVIVLNYSIAIGIHATGKVKAISVISGTFYLLMLPAAWIMLRHDMAPQVVFYAMTVSNIIIYISNIIILKRQAPVFDAWHASRISIATALIFGAATAVAMIPSAFMDTGFLRLLISISFSTTLTGLLFWFFMLDGTSRKVMKASIKKKLKAHK